MNLILASNNSGKIAELKALLPHVSVQTMREAGFDADIEEPHDSFRLNALAKAAAVWNWASQPVLSDDSGLCVTALGGAPGVYSARYAGPGATDQLNNDKLLKAMRDVDDRRAHYVAVLCLILDGEAHYFEGRCDGAISSQPRGSGGFGYDPLFIPDGYTRTFGQLDGGTKGDISHRAGALKLLRESGLLQRDS